MNTNKTAITNQALALILVAMSIFVTSHALASDLVCTGPHMGEIFIDTKTGMVTKSAEESLKVPIVTEKTHYGFVFKGKINQFKATVNRATGQIILDEACTPQCWGGPIFGTCSKVKAKL